MYLRSLATGSALALAVSLSGPAPSAAAEVTWEGYTYSPATAVAYKGLEAMARDFEAATNGRVAIKLNGGGSLPIKATNITQAVGEGVLALGGDGFYVGNVPLGGLLFLPGLLLTPEELETAYSTIEPALQEEFAKLGVELLAFYHYPLQVLWSPSELKGWDDLSGKKVRVTSPEQGEFVTRFGGIPVTLSSSEVAPALQRGVIDVVITASSAGARRYEDSLKYSFQIGPNLHPSFIIANREAFAKLSGEEQAALRRLAKEAGAAITAQLAADESEVTAKFKEAGMVVTTSGKADADRLVAEMRSYWDEWAKARGPEAAEVLGKVRKALGR